MQRIYSSKYWINRLGIYTTEADLIFCINDLDHLSLSSPHSFYLAEKGRDISQMSSAAERLGICRININKRSITFYGSEKLGYSPSREDLEKVLQHIENYPEYLSGFKFILQPDRNIDRWQVLNYGRVQSQKIDKRKRA